MTLGGAGQGEKVLEEYICLKMRIHAQRGGEWKVLGGLEGIGEEGDDK